MNNQVYILAWIKHKNRSQVLTIYRCIIGAVMWGILDIALYAIAFSVVRRVLVQAFTDGSLPVYSNMY